MRTANRDRQLAVSNFEHVQSLKRLSAVCQRLDTSVNQLKNELKSPINVRVLFSDGIVKRCSVTVPLHVQSIQSLSDALEFKVNDIPHSFEKVSLS